MLSLNKSERLCSKSSTTELFLKGVSINEEPFRIIFLASDYKRKVYFKSQFIVPKRHITRAVDRNLIKRQMREALRKNKIMLIKNKMTGREIPIAGIDSSLNFLTSKSLSK